MLQRNECEEAGARRAVVAVLVGGRRVCGRERNLNLMRMDGFLLLLCFECTYETGKERMRCML
jgi:hypothetical protein